MFFHLFIFFILLTLFGCGHYSALPLEGSQDSPPDLDFSTSEPCQGFATKVISFNPGNDATFGAELLPNIVLGPPEGNGTINGSLDVVSLGFKGEIILDVGACRITDGEGADFIIFENAFWIGGNEATPFKELAKIAISNDGIQFTEFPCNTQQYPFTGCAGWRAVYSNSENGISPFDVSNAGGEAFDLSEINVSNARFIRIRDVAGGGFYPSVGFDLDAVAVVNGMK